MVNDCIKISRKRENGKEECFSRIKDVVVLDEKVNAKKRFLRVKEVFPSWEEYCKKYGSNK